MAKKGGESRIVINMACEACKRRNYTTYKNKKNDPERLDTARISPVWRAHGAQGNEVGDGLWVIGDRTGVFPPQHLTRAIQHLLPRFCTFAGGML